MCSKFGEPWRGWKGVLCASGYSPSDWEHVLEQRPSHLTFQEMGASRGSWQSQWRIQGLNVDNQVITTVLNYSLLHKLNAN